MPSTKMLAAVAAFLILSASFVVAQDVDATGPVGYGHSLYFPFGGKSGAGLRDFFQAGDFPDAITIDLWVKHHDGGAVINHFGRQVAYTATTKDDTNYVQLIRYQHDDLDMAASIGGNENTMDTRQYHRMQENIQVLDPPNGWHRQTRVITPTTERRYQDGQLVWEKLDFENKPLSFDPANHAYVTFGQYTFQPGETIRKSNFYGQLDNIQMYSKALTTAEIAANWKKPLLSANDADLKVYHTFEESTITGNYYVNQGSGGASYDLHIGGNKDGTTFSDSTLELDFTGTKPFGVISEGLPLEGTTTELLNDVGPLYAGVAGYSQAGAAYTTEIKLPFQIEVETATTGALTDGTGTAINPTGGAVAAATDTIRYTPPALSSPQVTRDQLSYYLAGDRTVLRTMTIHVSEPLKVEIDNTNAKYTPTPVEDKLFSMNIGCHNSLGLPCSVKVVEDNENCLYNAKYMSNAASDFNLGGKLSVGDALLGPGYAVCKLAADKSGLVSDAAKFELSDTLKASVDVTVTYDIAALDDVPISASQTVNVQEDSAPTKITLGVTDPETDMHTIAITKLPSKGKLYFENSDGSIGSEISVPFSACSGSSNAEGSDAVVAQYAFNVTAVSSFWGNGQNVDCHPIQVLGPPSTSSFGDSIYTWSPLWKAGGSTRTADESFGVSFDFDPVAYHAENGAWEFIEVNYTESVYITGVEIGENRGMGAVNQVRTFNAAENKYYKLWEGQASNDIQKHHAKFSEYRKFGPTVCQPPFKTNTVRIELDTSAVPDWNEIDYIYMMGLRQLPHGVLEHPSRSVYYKPDKDAYGADDFEFVSYDCPYDRYRKSNTATVTVQIAQVNDAPAVSSTTATAVEGSKTALASLGFLKNTDDDEINLKISAVSGAVDLFDGSARVESLPHTGKLSEMSLTLTNCVASEIQFTMKDTGGSPESDLQTVTIEGDCYTRPAACGPLNWNFVASGCDDNNERKGTYTWKNPQPGNHLLPSDCCIVGQNFGANGSPCVEGSALPSNFTFDCEYIVADSPVSIAMIAILVLIIVVLLAVMTVFAMKTSDVQIKRSQPVFVILACGGGVVGLLTPFFMIGKPSDVTCGLTPFCTFFGVGLMYSAFLTKMIRIDLIFNNQNMKKVVLKTSKMLVTFGQICGFVTIMLIVHLAVAPPEARTEFRIVNGESVAKSVCKDNTGDITFLLTVFVHACLVIYGAYTAYKIRNVQDDFQESKSIGFGLYNTTCVCVVIVPVVLALDLEITVRFILVTLATGIAFGGTCIGITGAKAFYAATGLGTGSTPDATQSTVTDILGKNRSQSFFSMNPAKRGTSMVVPIQSPKITPPPTNDQIGKISE